MSTSNRPSAMELKNQMCSYAERIAKDGFGIQLDYSTNSIKQVDRILGVLHENYKKSGSEEGLQGVALEFGAYIVRVIEKNFGYVDWQRDHPQFGADTFPLYFKDRILFPVGWCIKRIYDGEGDDVWFKFQGTVLSK